MKILGKMEKWVIILSLFLIIISIAPALSISTKTATENSDGRQGKLRRVVQNL